MSTQQPAVSGGLRALAWLSIVCALALTVGPAGLLFPRAVRPIFVTWLTLAFPIGWVISRLVLMLLYWGVMTPVAADQLRADRDHRHADFGTAVAAIPQHEQHHRLKCLEIGAVDDRAAEAPRRHEPRAGQDSQMRRHGVLRHRERLGDVTGGKPPRLVLRQQAKHVEPGRLSKRRQRQNGLF